MITPVRFSVKSRLKNSYNYSEEMPHLTCAVLVELFSVLCGKWEAIHVWRENLLLIKLSFSPSLIMQHTLFFKVVLSSYPSKTAHLLLTALICVQVQTNKSTLSADWASVIQAEIAVNTHSTPISMAYVRYLPCSHDEFEKCIHFNAY